MKRMNNLLTRMSLLLLTVLLCACTTETVYIVEDDTAPKVGDSVRVEFLCPEVYTFATPQNTTTRAYEAVSLEKRLNDEQKPQLTKTPLKDGALLWLLSQKKKGNTYSDPVLGGYKVKYNTNGYPVFSPCQIKRDDQTGTLSLVNIETEENGSPLYITVGDTCRFLIMSPALELQETTENGNNTYKVFIKNGVYFASTDNRYTETKASDKYISPESVDSNGVQYVKLNPIVEQTARVKVTVVAGDGVYDINIMNSGVEVSGLQNAYDKEGKDYLWSLDQIEDTLEMHLGDKNTRVVIPQSDFTEYTTESGKKALTGDIGILPTDIMSTVMYILVNVEVNGVPTQYVTQLSMMRLYHGFSYNVTLKVSIQDGVSVATWYNDSWTEDLEPEKKE